MAKQEIKMGDLEIEVAHGGGRSGLQRYLPHHLSRLMNILNMRLLENLRSHGISIRQFRVMQMLDDRGQATISEIAADTLLEQSVVSRVVGQLERSKLAVRRKRRTNARHVDVSLTALGAKMFAVLRPYAKRIEEDAMSALTQREFDVLEALLLKVFQHVTRPYEPWKQVDGGEGDAHQEKSGS